MSSVVLDVTRCKNPHSGLGQYAIHLGNALLDQATEEFNPDLYLHPGTERHFTKEDRDFASPVFWEKEGFRGFARWIPSLKKSRPSPAIWHTFDQLSSFGPVDSKVPVVFTIHDLNFPDRSEKSKARGLRTIQKRIDRATIIVTISNYSEKQIRRFLDTKGKPIRVIYSGHCLDESVESERHSIAPSSPFLFSIGEFRSTKNFHLLISFIEQLPEFHLVLAGNFETEYGKRVYDQAQKSTAANRIHFPGKISDEARRWFYENCTAFLFPSVAEGFGLPVLEAMSCGKPVFTTREMSLPEIAGPLSFYCDSYETKNLIETFQNGMNDFDSNPRYPDKLKAYASQFSWKKTASAFIDLYREILS